jgi:hypothetical protein
LWSATNHLSGIHLAGDSNHIRGLNFANCVIHNNHQHGVDAPAVGIVNFTGCEVNDNGIDAANTYSGYSFGPFAVGFSVTGGRAGAGSGASFIGAVSPTQKYGVAIATGADRYAINLPDLNGNITGPILEPTRGPNAAPSTYLPWPGPGSTVTVNSVACTLGSTCAIAPAGAAGGDLSGSYPNPTVAKINGVAVPAGPYVIGDLLYAGTTTSLLRLADAAAGNVLRAGGVGAPPAWGAVNLATDVGATILPGANGGTGVANTGKTITIGANLTTTGVGAPIFTFSGTSRTFTFPDASVTLAAINFAQTWTAAQSFNSGTLKLNGATSGAITLNAAATAGSNTITLPAGTTDFSATGGASQVVKQTSALPAHLWSTVARSVRRRAGR